MTDSTGSFFIELSTIFDPKGFNAAQNKIEESESSFSNYFNTLEGKSNDFATSFERSSQKTSTSALNSFGDFFDITSQNFLDLETLTKQVFSNMALNIFDSFSSVLNTSLFDGLFGGGTSIFGGLLGSRRSGGAISKTGAYYLHEGEFVLPPEIVDDIKNSTAPKSNITSNGSGSQQNVLNVVVNTPITLTTNNAEVQDARSLCEEISSAARRGVSWAVEQAKISYKIGKQKNQESSL